MTQRSVRFIRKAKARQATLASCLLVLSLLCFQNPAKAQDCSSFSVSLANTAQGSCVGIASLSVSSSQSTSLLSWYNGSTLVYTANSQSAVTGTTVAGVTSTTGSAANQLNSPNSVLVDASGAMYIADELNHRIQKWAVGATSGTTVAGGNGAGSAANQLNQPKGIYVDASGAVYVADYLNHRIQKWTPGASAGTTVAGGNSAGSGANQLSAPEAVYVDASGAVYIADVNNHRIQKWASGGYGLPASSGTTVAGGNGNGSLANQLSFPAQIYVDGSGAIYIADYNNDRIQKWAAGGTSGTTVAGGNGFGQDPNQLNGPRGLAVDASGALYIANQNNQRVVKWAAGASTGIIVAGGNGFGSAANQLNSPGGVYVDASGTLYIADKNNHRIQKWLSSNMVYAPTTAGVYTVRVTGVNGCTATTNGVTITAPPAITITANPSFTLVEGQSTTLTASSGAPVGAASYIWNTGATTATITINTAQTYSVNGPTGGCLAVGAAVVSPAPCTPPTVNLANTAQGSCVGIASLSVSSNQPTSLLSWYNGSTLVYTANSQSAVTGTTVAGESAGISGTAATQLTNPAGVFVDATGAIYIADYNNHRIQKWPPGGYGLPATSGTTVAGVTSTSGTATNRLNRPRSVFVDAQGTMYIVDQFNSRVLKWAAGATSGTVVAGGNGVGSAANQLLNPTGIYVDADGTVYVADATNHRIQKWAVGATTGITVAGSSTPVSGSGAAQLNGPSAVYIDASGAMYIADYNNHRIQKWAAGATSGTTVAGGNGAGNANNQLNGPRSFYVDASGTLYIASETGQRVQKWAAGATSGTTVAGGSVGPGANQLNAPTGVTVDGSGAIYIADFGNHRIQRWLSSNMAYTPTTAGVYTVLVTGTNGCTATTNGITITSASPVSIAASSLTIVEGQNATLTASGATSYIWNTGETTGTISINTARTYSVTGLTGGCLALATITISAAPCIPPTVNLTNTGPGDCVGVTSLSVSSSQEISQLSWFNGTTLVSGINSRSAITVAGITSNSGSGANQLNQPNGVWVDAAGAVYIADQNNHRVQKWAAGATSGTTVAGGNGAGNAANQLNQPRRLYVNAAGAVYVVDYLNNRIQMWAPGSTSGVTVAGGNNAGSGANQLNAPEDVYVDGSGAVYITDANNHRVQKWAAGASSGTTVAGGNGQGSAANQLRFPFGLYVNASGAIYVSDGGNQRVQKWAAGAISGTTVAGGNGFGEGPTQLNGPRGLAVDASGAIYIANQNNQRVLKWEEGASTGIIVAGGNGFGGAANQLNAPADVFVDASGAIFVADYANHRIQKWTSSPVSPVFRPTTTGQYTARLTNPAGCTVATNAITITAPPVVAITPALQTITAGSATTLTASGTNNFRWSTGQTTVSIVVSPTSTSAFSVTGTTGGCSATATAIVNTTTCPPQTVNLANVGAGSCLSLASLKVSSSQAFDKLAWYNGSTLVNTATSQVITSGTTVAGGNGPGPEADKLDIPISVYVDATGAIYISDLVNNRVQKWAPGGVGLPATTGITVAGDYGSGADQLDTPYGVAVDGSGAVYIVDQNNHRVQKWARGATSGTTVAGVTGMNGSTADKLELPTGVYVDAGGAVYIVDQGNHRVQKWAPGATSGTTVAGGNNAGPGANQLDTPVGVYVDASGAVYVADQYNHRVQKWAPGAMSGTTVAGVTGMNGSAADQLDTPVAVYGDAYGAIYVADGLNNRIQKWAPGASAGVTVAGGNGDSDGPDQLNFPSGVYVDATGAIYIADAFNNRIQKWASGAPSPVYTPLTAGQYSVGLTAPNGCTATSNAITITAPPVVSISPVSPTNTAGSTITLTASGATSYTWNTGETTASIAVSPTSTTPYSVTGVTGGCSATVTTTVSTTVCPPQTVSLTSVGLGNCLGVASLSVSSNQPIRQLDWYNGATLAYLSGLQPATIGTTVAGITSSSGSEATKLSNPNGVWVDASGAVYVVDIYNHRIQKWAAGASTGVTVAGGNGAGSGASQLNQPKGFFVDAGGTVYVADELNHRIQKWTPGATSGVTVAGGNGAGPGANEFNSPEAVYVDANGAIYIADVNNHRVQKWAAGASSGTTVAGFNGRGSGAEQLSFPTSIYVDASGAVYIADYDNHRVQKWAAGGYSGTTVAGGNGFGQGDNQLNGPRGIFVDGSGAIYVACQNSQRIQKWAAGVYSGTTVAGGNGPGNGANQLSAPASVFVDGSGAMYIADYANHRVQKWALGPVNPVYTPLTAGSYSVLVTAPNGCTATTNAVTISTPPSVSISPVSSTITAGTNATLTALGGTESYIWSTGETTVSIVVSPASTTVFSVTGVTGTCSATATATITVNPAVTATIAGNLTICLGQITTLTASGAGDGGSYRWSNGATTAAISTTLGGTYSVTATSTVGVSSTASVTVVRRSLPTATITPYPSLTICQGQSVTLAATNGVAGARVASTAPSPLFYIWSTGASGATLPFSPASSSVISLTVSDGFCSSLPISVSLTMNPIVTASIAVSGRSTFCAGQIGTPTGTTLTASGGNAFIWSNGITTAVNPVSPQSTIVYSVTVTNTSMGCQSVTAITITVNPLPSLTITATPSQSITPGGSVTLTASGATSYTWSNGVQSSSVVLTNVTSATTFSVRGETGECSGTASAAVSLTCDPTVIADAVSLTQTAVLGPANCSVELTGTGFGTGYTIRGPNGYVFSAVYRKVGYYSINALNVKLPGTYTLTVSYTNACGQSSFDTMTYVVGGEACP